MKEGRARLAFVGGGSFEPPFLWQVLSIYDKTYNTMVTLIIRKETRMLFYSEGTTLGICHRVGLGVFCFDLGMQSLPEGKPAI